jgi:hypothetical protein
MATKERKNNKNICARSLLSSFYYHISESQREREREKEECKVVITLIIVYIEMKHTRLYRL